MLKSLFNKETPTQVFFCEYCETFKNSLFYKTPLVAPLCKLWMATPDLYPSMILTAPKHCPQHNCNLNIQEWKRKKNPLENPKNSSGFSFISCFIFMFYFSFNCSILFILFYSSYFSIQRMQNNNCSLVFMTVYPSHIKWKLFLMLPAISLVIWFSWIINFVFPSFHPIR